MMTTARDLWKFVLTDVKHAQMKCIQKGSMCYVLAAKLTLAAVLNERSVVSR